MENNIKLAIAGDSAGEHLAEILASYCHDHKNLTVDLISKPDDQKIELYANLSDRVCSDVIRGVYDRAILICGTGIGVCIAANKIPGIRAALVHDTYSAAKASTSNDAQIITMGARVIGAELAKIIIDAWLNTKFDKQGSSAKNVHAINQVDQKYNTSSQ